ncbi:hypothetical protein C8J56DRAFT_1036083 [Mycena floridula]|nr:hypothetical protein C8J56DRAFT_1036083 [Mycena floridula]
MSHIVSFTVRRPTQLLNSTYFEADSDSAAPGSPLARSNTSSPNQYSHDMGSSDEDDVEKDELVTVFDRFGAQRSVSTHSSSFRLSETVTNGERKHLSARQFIPALAKAQTGADGSVGGLEDVVDSINSGLVLPVLQVRNQIESTAPFDATQEEAVTDVDAKTEDQIAIRTLLIDAT